MSKKSRGKGSKHENENEARIAAGITILRSNALFDRFVSSVRFQTSENMDKSQFVIGNGDGIIQANSRVRLEPDVWAHFFAHACLHLAFGHYEAEKMPGIEEVTSDGVHTKKVVCDNRVWNTACDLYIEHFLIGLKVGRPLDTYDDSSFGGSLRDEISIYHYLMEHPGEMPVGVGTAGNEMDMKGLDTPIRYTGRYQWRQPYTKRFAYALADSVSRVVAQAGGNDPLTGQKYTAAQKAANWFINHYPLLGGIATGFKIIEDYQLCQKEEIMIAAVSSERGEIYVNPAAGLKEEELKFVMAHEFLHAGLMHGEREEGRDPYLWNVACDYVINGWLKEMQIGQMPEQGALYDENIRNVSAEELYDKIIHDIRKYRKLNTLRGYGKGDIIAGGIGSHGNTVSLDDFYKNALRDGLEFHIQNGRGYLPAGLIQEIRALSVPPIRWDVELARWFDGYFMPLEKHRTYARPSRRQGATPEIPRPSYVCADIPEDSRTFGVIVDTSGSMSSRLLGLALGAIASYSISKDVPYARVVFCDADAYDIGYVAPEDIAGRVQVKGRGGTVLQPGVNVLEHAKDFPKNGPILIITDGEIESNLQVRHEHAYLIPKGKRLPYRPKGKVFYFD